MSLCGDCGLPVEWRKEGERWRCYNPGTQVDHWDRCSRERWEQTKATGEPFDDVKVADSNGKPTHVSGFANSVHGTKYREIVGRWIVGAKCPKMPFRHQPGCAALPWDDCACRGKIERSAA